MSDDAVFQGYRASRLRLSELARSFDATQAATPVAACPGWTVKDTLAHLAGLAADVVGGNVPDGVPTDEFTAREVAERADRTVPEVLGEWDRVGPEFESLLQALGADAPRNAAVDVWSHECDIRSALGISIPADGGPAARLLDGMVRRGIGRSWGTEGHPPALRIVTDTDGWVAGEGDPAGMLRTTLFDLSRTMLGRRSPAQMAGMDWDGADPQPWIAALPVFGPNEGGVIDSAVEPS
ncbi:MAG: maleylpyruvate isomerase family mycothiol-dependent enzyme [Acidimicrobiia bacterium]|nr:maleylpyruvate isomerase family mycothiol-dependent enzyme [Acidimicrobiia bacterium]